ncbi:MAG: hypothetical protein LBF67_07570 [Prevotellaceae bacterium]|jgi:hypothetical protein|nr:hypothetical protein [Prevotellaceae bacterium]
MKRILFAIFAALACLVAATAQSPIAISAKIPESTVLGYQAQQVALKKLQQLATINNVGSQADEARFWLTPQVSIVESNITSTAPPRQLVKLSIVLMITDTVGSKNIVAQVELSAKGVGESEEKATINALQQVDIRSAALKRFMEQGKKKIAALEAVKAEN